MPRIRLKQIFAARDIPGIGEELAGKIAEIVLTGKCAFLERLHKEMPSAVTRAAARAGTWAKAVKILWHDLGSRRRINV